MGEAHTHLKALVSQLEADECINAETFTNCDYLTLQEQRAFGPFLAKRLEVDAFLGNSLTEVIWQRHQTLLAQVRDLAVQKARAWSHVTTFFDEEDRHVFCESLADDLAVVARGLCSTSDHPFSNGVWLTYKAGGIPSLPLDIPGSLAHFLTITKEEASRLVAQARSQAVDPRADFQRQEEQLAQAVANISGALPPGELLLQLLAPSLNLSCAQLATTRIITSLKEAGSSDNLPRSWQELLRYQDRSLPLPWEAVWGGFEQILPSVIPFLHEKCRGVGVLFRDGTMPELLYVYAFSSDRFPSGLDYQAYRGGQPLGDIVPAPLSSRFQMLPPSLQAFYRTVHDGWPQALLQVNGPLLLSQMKFLAEEFTAAECFGKGRPLFPLAATLEIMRLGGGGDALCLDTSKTDVAGNSPAIRFNHKAPRKSVVRLDFLPELNRLIEIGYADLLPRS